MISIVATQLKQDYYMYFVMDTLSNQIIMVKIIRTCLRNPKNNNLVKRKEN